VIETYAFTAAFAVQIFAMSILVPALFIRYCHAWPTVYPESFAQMYPGIEPGLAAERYGLSTARFANLFRAANWIIAVLGIGLLVWLFRQMQLPDWNHKYVVIRTLFYFVLQLMPLFGVGAYGVWYMATHKPPVTEQKRKATLQRRGLFDFVSPSAVAVSAVAYGLFIGLVIYLWQRGMSGSLTLFWIGFISAVCAMDAFSIYRQLYGRKHRFEPQEGRVDRMGLRVKMTVYINIAVITLCSGLVAFTQLDLEKWTPFALSSFFAVITFLMSMAVSLPRRPHADGLRSGDAPAG
jgi:hypothetical protein